MSCVELPSLLHLHKLGELMAQPVLAHKAYDPLKPNEGKHKTLNPIPSTPKGPEALPKFKMYQRHT